MCFGSMNFTSNNTSYVKFPFSNVRLMETFDFGQQFANYLQILT